MYKNESKYSVDSLKTKFSEELELVMLIRLCKIYYFKASSKYNILNVEICT